MAQMGVLWMAARCGQEVAWHERMGREAVVGLRGEDLVEESLECMTCLFDQVECEPSRVMYTDWHRQLAADEAEVQAIVGTEAVGEHVLVVGRRCTLAERGSGGSGA